MLPFNLCSLAIILLLSAICLSIEAQRVITATGTCIRDADCAILSEFCTENKRCRQRLRENDSCAESTQCEEGLYCKRKVAGNVCVKQAKPFKECSVWDDTPCGKGEAVPWWPSAVNDTFYCSASAPESGDSDECLPQSRAGIPCTSHNECQIGTYCKIEHFGFRTYGTCTPQKAPGAICGMSTDPSHERYECEGYCSFSLLPEISSGKCTSTSAIGQPCHSNYQCKGYTSSARDPKMNRNPKVICNVPKGEVGVCQNERDLIKKDGLRCNPRKDFCDDGRGLSCRWTSTGPRCMFNSFDGDRVSVPYCDPNSKFSKCNTNFGTPTECRPNVDPFVPQESKGFFQCLPKRETVPQGSICNLSEHTDCEKGMSCQAVPGIDQITRAFTSPTQFCVSVKQEGERCFSKFRFACATGLKCKNNVCVKGKPTNKITHADLNERCDILPCVPGTQCVTKFGQKECALKTVSKGEGEKCFSTGISSIVSFLIYFHVFEYPFNKCSGFKFDWLNWKT